MSSVELNDNEWGQVMGCMGYAPAREAVPLLNKIAAQLSAQHAQQQQLQHPGIKLDANGKEIRNE